MVTEVQREYARRFHERHPGYSRQYYQQNLGRIAEQQRKYYEQHRDEHLAYNRRYYNELQRSIPSPRSGEPWAEEDDLIVLDGRHSLIEICHLLGRSYGAVRARRKTLRRRRRLGD